MDLPRSVLDLVYYDFCSSVWQNRYTLRIIHFWKLKGIIKYSENYISTIITWQRNWCG